MPQPSTAISYDEVPYDGGLIDGVHPNTFAAIGLLFGMSPAPVETCSVLEIGCASGGNLVPMAYGLPGANFVGIDPAGAQLKEAERRADQLGITNLRLFESDIRDFAAGGMRFDYIVCHGVFSWVGGSVREAIFDACKRLLNPQGIAYISYNTLPGFYGRAAVRDALRFHASHFPETEDRIGQARAFLQFLQQATGHFKDPDDSLDTYRALVAHESAMLAGAADSYLAHEHLSDENQAFYFHEFAAMLPGHSLQYLGDAQFHTMVPWNLPPPVAAEVERLCSTQVLSEQYRDFVVNRAFRRSLVCHAGVSLRREIDSSVFSRLRLRLLRQRDADGGWSLTRPGGEKAPLHDAGLVRLMDYLELASPRCLQFSELAAQLSPHPADPDQLAGSVMTLLGYGAIELRVFAPNTSTDVPDRPVAFLPARLAALTDRTGWTPTPFHSSVSFARLTTELLAHLDGSKDISQLTSLVEEQLTLTDTGGRPLNTNEVRQLVEEGLEQLRYHGVIAPSKDGKASRPSAIA